MSSTLCTVNVSVNATVTANYAVPAPPPNAPTVTLQAAQTIQTWEAWRATALGPNFLVNSQDQIIPPSVMTSIVSDLANDLRLNGLRIELHQAQMIEAINDNSNPNVINWASFDFARTFRTNQSGPLRDPTAQMNQLVIPLRNQVTARGEPFNSYVSLIYDSGSVPAFWMSNPQEYAEMAEAFLRWLRGDPGSGQSQFSFVPTYWAIFNEPDVNQTADPTQYANLAIATGQRFAALGVNTKIQGLETAVPLSGRLNTFLSVPGVTPFLGIISYHGYDFSTTPPPFTDRNAIRDLAQARGIRTSMTEICCKSGWTSGGFSEGIGWARDIYWNMTQGNISSWEPLAVMGKCAQQGCTGGGQDPVLLDSDLSRHFKLLHYYALRQYSRYIRPGYLRVGSQCVNCGNDPAFGEAVKPVVFRSPAGKYVAVVINDSASAQDIFLAGFPAGVYDITSVDPTNTPQNPVTTLASQTIGAGQNMSVTFPSRAIVTFVQR